MKVPEAIDAEQRVPHPDAVEQRATGKLPVRLVVAQRELHRVDAEQGIVVFVVPVRARLTEEGPASGPDDRAGARPVSETRSDRVLQAGVIHWIQAAGHVQHVPERDLRTGVGLGGPRPWQPLEAERLVERHPTAIHEHAHERDRDALRSRPRSRLRHDIDAGRVALVYNLAVVHDHEAEGHLLG